MMPTITLADGSKKDFSNPTTVQTVAESIGPGLAKAALAARVDDRLVDTSYLIHEDAVLTIITDKDSEGLEILRHSCAHLLAHAVKELYPSAQITIGPVIEDGFYYDIALERTFTPEDVERIEAKMAEIAKQDLKVERLELTREQAIKLFKEMGEHYKVQIIEEIPEGESLTAYRQGDFIDLCRGPHIPRTGAIKAFKLTKLAGAYWRGDSNNEMLQRIYGTAWPDKKALQDYLHRIEEAEKRDHRKVAKKMGLFHTQQEAPGMAFWHPNGWTLMRILREYMRDKLRQFGYQEVATPQIVDMSLWEQSGHASKFMEEMFCVKADETHTYAIKPMNCPCHVQIFKQGIRSYRDLPIRFAEFGMLHRNEPSGTLHGLLRVRCLVQDDAHIFCTEDHIQGEVKAFIEQLHAVYRDFGFTNISHKLATRPDKRVGSDEVWDKAEQALAEALNASGVVWETLPGEGAFYGPKIEFHLTDCIGRNWQCGTMQVDFSMPDRLGAHYVAESGEKQPPVMLHRAMFGSFERFLAILLEEYADGLPLWLAPIQVVVSNITDRQAEYVQELVKKLQNIGIRVISDLRNEKIGFKIREHTIARVPYHVVIGDREIAERTVTARTLKGKQTQPMSFEAFVKQLQAEIDEKRQPLQESND